MIVQYVSIIKIISENVADLISSTTMQIETEKISQIVRTEWSQN